MAKSITAVRGTQDVLPSQSRQWQYVESTLLETARLAGFRERRVPVFENTELLTRSKTAGIPPTWCKKRCTPLSDKGGR